MRKEGSDCRGRLPTDEPLLGAKWNPSAPVLCFLFNHILAKPIGLLKIAAVVMSRRRKLAKLAGRSAAIVAVCVHVSCDSGHEQAQRELKAQGIAANAGSLADAIARDDRKLVALMLESGASAGEGDASGHSLLALAVQRRDAATLCMLLNAGANPNGKIAAKGSVLGMAIDAGDATLVNLLLASGADPNSEAADGEKVLFHAIRKRHTQMVADLIQSRPDPNLRDLKGNPLLHVAMDAGDRAAAEGLLGIGADPAARDAAGETALHKVIDRHWHELIPAMVDAGADLNACNQNSASPLCRAIATGDAKLVASLLKWGANPNLQTPNGNTPLAEAVNHDQAEMVSILLSAGANPFLATAGSQKPSAFDKAMRKSDPQIFDLIIARDLTPPKGWQPVIDEAFRRGDIKKARLLFSRGVRPSKESCRTRYTEEAASKGMIDFVKLFLDYNLPTGRALEEACARGNYEIASLLLASGAPANVTRIPTRITPLALALRGSHDDIAELLLLHGADPKLILPEGQTAFHVAIARGCGRALRQIIASGIDPNTPFIHPISSEFLELVREGAMKRALKFDQGVTPIMLAADSGNIATAKSLLDAGAKVNSRTRLSCYYPIHFAAGRGDVRMMRLFLGKDPHREERHIEISLGQQMVRLYDATGNELFASKVSTGRKGNRTPTGEFVITNKHRHWTSTIYHSSMPYFQRLSCGDFGLHQGVLPGYPASRGCIRMPAQNAAKLFAMTDTGDRVRIVP